MFLDVKFLKRELLKNEIIFAHFFPYLTHVFLTRKIFCYRNQKVRMLYIEKIFLSEKRP